MNNKYFLTLSFVILGAQFCTYGMIPFPPRADRQNSSTENPEYLPRGTARNIPNVFIFNSPSERDTTSPTQNENLKNLLTHCFKVGAALGSQKLGEALVVGGVSLGIDLAYRTLVFGKNWILGESSSEYVHQILQQNQQLKQALNQVTLLNIQMKAEKHELFKQKEEKKFKLFDEDLKSKKLDNERKEIENEQLRKTYRATTANTVTASLAD